MSVNQSVKSHTQFCGRGFGDELTKTNDTTFYQATKFCRSL